jgi:hypothetical protein
MKTVAALVLALLAPCAAFAQAPAAAANCVSQYEDLAGKSAAALVAAGYGVSSAVPGGLWLLKDKELAYCNANNRAREGEVLCWKLREPLKGQACS